MNLGKDGSAGLCIDMGIAVCTHCGMKKYTIPIIDVSTMNSLHQLNIKSRCCSKANYYYEKA